MDEIRPVQQKISQSLSDSLKAHEVLGNASCWMIAVSGGVDSMVLLHAVVDAQKIHQKRIIVLHFNHQLRGTESDDDSSWLVKKCRDWDVECIVGKGNVSLKSDETGESIEMAARSMRHTFFVEQARLISCPVLILAHHLDDQLELVLMRLMRGSGPDGLAGMSPIHRSPFGKDLYLWRPFLRLNREEILCYAKHHQLEWREDSSNSEISHLRNRVRHELIPKMLEDFGPAVKGGILRSSDLIKEEHSYIIQAALSWEENVDFDHGFKELPTGLQRELVRRALIRLGVKPEFEWIERIRNEPYGSFWELPSGLKVQFIAHYPLLEPREQSAPMKFNDSSLDLVIHDATGNVSFSGCNIRWERAQGDVSRYTKFKRKAGVEIFDADIVGERVLLRHWKAGDRVQPIGFSGSIKLQDWFVNEKVDVKFRRELIVAESEERGVFWIEGMRMMDAFKVTARTQTLLFWNYSR